MMNDTHYLVPDESGALYWGPLTCGRLVSRYKRFLADVELDDGRLITAHTPNTGRMLGCSEPGRLVWLSKHDRPGRKYAYTLEMIEMPAESPGYAQGGGPMVLVGVNTMVPNRLVAEAAGRGLLAERWGDGGKPGRSGSLAVEREVPVGQSRLDLRLTDADGRVAMIEVKNCTLAENSVAYFPDAVTARGEKHLRELAELARAGLRAVVFILVQRADADLFRPADHIDPAWGRSLREVVAGGVEIWAYRADLDLEKIRLGPALEVDLS